MSIYLTTSTTALPADWQPPEAQHGGSTRQLVSGNRKRAITVYTDGFDPLDTSSFTRELVNDSEDPAVKDDAKWQSNEDPRHAEDLEEWRHNELAVSIGVPGAVSEAKPPRDKAPFTDAVAKSLVKELARGAWDDETPSAKSIARGLNPNRRERAILKAREADEAAREV